MSAPANLQAEWAGLFIDGLVAAGIRDVVVSPGSRSTPWVLAAGRHPLLRCHPVVDERSAAFFALGMAKVTGTASLLVCTSGTAGAHYLPALVEASLTRTPLLVLTADRPFELQHCGASQTIDQVKLFGGHARAFIDLGMPDEAPGALRWLHHRAAHAVHLTRSPVPGPVHVNARAKKPLEPGASRGAAEESLTRTVAEIASAGTPCFFGPAAAPSPDGVRTLVRACMTARRGLLVAGPAPLSQGQDRAAAYALAQATGFPLLVEAASQLRFSGGDEGIDAFDAVCRLSRFARGEGPDLVIQLGAAPTSSAWERYLAASLTCARYVVAETAEADPASAARAHVLGPVSQTLTAVVDGLAAEGFRPEPTAWHERWREANRLAWEAVDAAQVTSEPLSEAAAVRAAVRSVPAAGLLALGNSLPIREVDTLCPMADAQCGVLSQRGASGIDGLLSSAAGAAATGRPTTLLLGDVSFLHDVGGLAVSRSTSAPLTVVVINNDGGRMFEQLPVATADRAGVPLELWTTPHGLSPAAVAQAYGVPCARATHLLELEQALAVAQQRAGRTVIEAVVAPSSAQEFYRRLDAELERRLP